MFDIAVPVKSGVEFLPSALESLARQQGLARVAVLDASGDARVVALVERHRDIVAYSRHAARDDGQSAAIIEGWAQLDGPFVGWLNADDLLFPGALAKVAAAFAAAPDVDVVYGHAVFVDACDAFTGYFPSISATVASLGLSCVVCQPSCFVRRSALARVAGLDVRRHYTMDWDLWLQLRDAGCRFLMLDAPLSAVRNLPDTKTFGGGTRRRREIDALMAPHAGWVERLRTQLGDRHFQAVALGRRGQRLGWATLAGALAVLARPHARLTDSLFGLSRMFNRVESAATVALPFLRDGEFALTVAVEGPCPGLTVTAAGRPVALSADSTRPGLWHGRFAARGADMVAFELRAETPGWRLRRLAVTPSPLMPQDFGNLSG